MDAPADLTPVVVTLPAESARRLESFLAAKETGQIVLDVKLGNVLSGHATAFWKEIVDKS